MILANYAQVNRNVARDFGPAFSNPLACLRPWHYMGFYVPDTAQPGREKSAFPDGANTHEALVLAPKSGGVSSHFVARPALTPTAHGALGRNVSGTASPTLTTTATGNRVVSGTGAVLAAISTTATALAALNAAGAASMSVSVSATGKAIAEASGSASMSSSASLVSRAVAHAAGHVNLGAIALDASNFSAHLLDEEDIETGLTLRQALRIITAATAGRASGAETSTIRFRNAQADTKDRITATVDAYGNRSAVVLDVS